jgi:hypothetical protein
MPRVYRVPFGRWLIPISGILSCLLLMKGLSKGTVYRFVVWTIIGQIIYFSYGFRHSKHRQTIPVDSSNGQHELISTVANSSSINDVNTSDAFDDDSSFDTNQTQQ